MRESARANALICGVQFLFCVYATSMSAGPFSFFFQIFWIMDTPPPVPLVLYFDCLQARRHFPVKVSLMNSNDPGEWLRQVLHNHSSFTFSSRTVTSLFFLPSLLLFLQLNQAPVPIKGRNLLSLSFFYCACWVEPLNCLIIRMDASKTFSYDEQPETLFLGMSYKTPSQRSKSPKWKPVFPITPLSQMPCPSFTTTNTSKLHWSYSDGFPVKNVLNETIHQHCSIKT